MRRFQPDYPHALLFKSGTITGCSDSRTPRVAFTLWVYTFNDLRLRFADFFAISKTNKRSLLLNLKRLAVILRK
jgi:hypothetical protein